MNILSWLSFGIGLVMFLGAAAVYLRGSRDKGTIETLERNNKALAERVGILETNDAANKVRITALTQANEVLTNTVNSSELILALKSDLHEHHGAAMEGLEQIHADLAGLPSLLATAMRGKP